MTPKRQRFVEEYLIDLNATAAYRRAGYAGDDNVCAVEGHRLLSDPKVGSAIAEAAAARSEKVGIDADYVLRQAVKLHERCMQEVSPMTDRKGDPIRDEAGNPLFEFDSLGASKALELVGKHVSIQAFKEKVEHSGAMTLLVTPEDAGL